MRNRSVGRETVSQAAYGLGSAKRRERNHLSRVYGLGRNPAQLFRRASRERVMAASDATVREMAKALRRHVDQQTLERSSTICSMFRAIRASAMRRAAGA